MPIILTSPPAIDLYFVGMWPDFEDAFLHNAALPGINIGVVNLRRKKNRYSYKILPNIVRFAQLRRRLSKLLEQNPKAIFVFQDNDRLLRLLSCHHFKNTIHLLLRNTVSTKPQLVACLKDLLQVYPTWSFDPQDCKKYGLNYYPQFIAPIETATETKNTDLLFVGYDKNRRKLLTRLNSLCLEAGLVFECIIVDKERIPYEKYIGKLKSTRCLVDVAQEGQSGLTLRPLEALLYRKKLLSNSTAIDNCGLNKGDWFLVDNFCNITADCLSLFLEKSSNFHPVELLECHRVERLIEKIVRHSVVSQCRR